MADKSKPFSAPSKTVKTKRLSTVGGPSSSRGKIPPSAPKEKARTVSKRNTTILGDGDMTICKQEGSMPDFDGEYRQIAYGKFLRAMLEECIVDEKIEREETVMDVQMAQLVDRFQKTMDQLDKTSKRLKDISFVVEQNRLLELKNRESSQFYATTDNSNAQELLLNLNASAEACLDKLEIKNVDFGYNKESGHQQLLDAVNDAIDGLNEIKKHSNLDPEKFKEYEKSETNVRYLEKDHFDLESLKTEFDAKFPKFSERLLKEASEKIAKMIENDDDDD